MKKFIQRYFTKKNVLFVVLATLSIFLTVTSTGDLSKNAKKPNKDASVALEGNTKDVRTSSVAPSGDSVSQQEHNYKMGECARYGDLEMTLTNVQRCSGDDYDKPKEGMEYVIVTLKIKNVGTNKAAYNPYFFRMKNSKNELHDKAHSSANSHTALKSGILLPEEQIEGSLLFEEFKGDNGLILQFQDNVRSKDAKLNFKLK